MCGSAAVSSGEAVSALVAAQKALKSAMRKGKALAVEWPRVLAPALPSPKSAAREAGPARARRGWLLPVVGAITCLISVDGMIMTDQSDWTCLL